jgi:ribonuclease P protein component
MVHLHRFRRKEHLRTREDIARVFAERRRAGDDVLLVYVAENGFAWSRLGLSVGRKVGNAVRRNYVRRRIREAFRLAKDDLPRGLDILCVAKPDGARSGCDFAQSLRTLVQRAARK